MIQRLKPLVSALFYCLLASTTLRLLKGAGCLTLALSVSLLAPPATHAQVLGQYTVANCESDPAGYSVKAFTHFIHKGMKVRYACAPSGSGVRGVVTQNIVRKGRVKRGSMAKVTIVAPAGTEILKITWEAWFRRVDCRYALQVWADRPGTNPIPLAHTKANRGCARKGRAQAAQARETTYSIPGATSISQRVVCVGRGKQNWCSTRNANYISTEKATVVLRDAQPPMVQILADTPLATGAWVSGDNPLNYTASDNIGVQLARAVIGGLRYGLHARPCFVTSPGGPFTALQPCPNGAGQIAVDTRDLPEGTQQLTVQAEDAAGNAASSEPSLARIDNTAPARIDVSLEGGDHWRNQNAWVATWSNPGEGDRAPIVAATYRLCSSRSTASCDRDTQAVSGISRLRLTVPGPGEWTLSIWRNDAAGNQSEAHASIPVILRYDPQPPQLAFERPESADPTLLAVSVIDELSGLADGAIEIAPSGSGMWQTLTTQWDANRLLARIDDATLPAGSYVVRARASDRAGNQTTLDRRGDGQPMIITLPLRKAAVMVAGFERSVRRPRKRRGAVVLRPTARVGFGERVRVAGRLTTDDGRAMAGAPVQLFATNAAGEELAIGTVTTDRSGRFRTVTTGVHSRDMRLAYPGSPIALPVQETLSMRVPADTSAKVSPRRVRNGKQVRFRGRVRGLPVPANGKLIEIQVRFTDRWQTFRTTRSDALGRWSSRYRFQRTRGVQRYRFRVRLPKEAGYPFETSVSRTLWVQVSGT